MITKRPIKLYYTLNAYIKQFLSDDENIFCIIHNWPVFIHSHFPTFPSCNIKAKNISIDCKEGKRKFLPNISLEVFFFILFDYYLLQSHNHKNFLPSFQRRKRYTKRNHIILSCIFMKVFYTKTVYYIVNLILTRKCYSYSVLCNVQSHNYITVSVYFVCFISLF